MSEKIKLADYIITVINLTNEDTEEGNEALKSLVSKYGEQVATYSEVEEAMGIMTSALVDNAFISEKVSHIFLESILALLETKNLISVKDTENVLSLVDNAKKTLTNKETEED